MRATTPPPSVVRPQEPDSKPTTRGGPLLAATHRTRVSRAPRAESGRTRVQRRQRTTSIHPLAR
jgi:hypothetical protein